MSFELSRCSVQGGNQPKPTRVTGGFTLIEVLIATAIAAVIFIGFFQAYLVAGNLAWNAKARLGGQAIAVSEIEYMRSLPYTGVHNGPDDAAVLNGIPYTIRTTVKHLHGDVEDEDCDDDEDCNDYKSVKVEVDWVFRGSNQNVVLVTYLAR
jgi:prepilin-type N-terminal cleavage/methylation domain-containing protein